MLSYLSTREAWRHRRRLRLVERELARLDARWAREAGVRRRRAPAVLRALVGSVLVVTLVGVFVAHHAAARWDLYLTVDEGRIHLGPARAPSGPGHFRFMMTQPHSGSPVAYDPCRPITYEVNDALAPAGSEGIVEEAVAAVEEATGLELTYLGTTDRLPPDYDAVSRIRSEPVLVAWTTPEVVDRLGGDVVGLGGSRPDLDPFSERLHYVTGEISLDAPQLSSTLDRLLGRAKVRAVVMHELAHLVGLDHVEDPDELMSAENYGKLAFGPGDLRGLARLGSGRCFLDAPFA